MNKEIQIIKEQLPREELVEHYKSISKLNKKYCKDNIELQQRIDKAIDLLAGFDIESILRGEE